MGDRAYVEAVCSVADAPRFENAGFVEGFRPGLPTGLVVMIDEEGPEGNTNALREFAADGLAFRGWHDSGAAYDGACFAAIDGRYHEVPRLNHSDLPCIEVHVDGTIDAEQFRAAVDYLVASNAVAHKFGLPSGPVADTSEERQC